MDQLRFNAGLGSYSVSAPPDAVAIFAGLGGHYFQMQVEVGVPEVDPEAGQFVAVGDHAVRPSAGWSARATGLGERFRRLQADRRGPPADRAIPDPQRSTACTGAAARWGSSSEVGGTGSGRTAQMN